ncbi:hypothetical protein [Paenibacillus sp. sgz5001063]|uniref:hypothetical protein n=1 Tax=Paenibacillus sp. sgz5001063 TaxID=3242474 RepID=UPI0036D412A9
MSTAAILAYWRIAAVRFWSFVLRVVLDFFCIMLPATGSMGNGLLEGCPIPTDIESVSRKEQSGLLGAYAVI